MYRYIVIYTHRKTDRAERETDTGREPDNTDTYIHTDKKRKKHKHIQRDIQVDR